MIKRAVRDLLRHRAQRREHDVSLRAEWQIEREIEDAVRSADTLVVGPWLSEVGFETLYWIPFLRWVRDAFRLDPARVVAVSRGGVASWYADVAGRYVEIWDEVPPAACAARVAERGTAKQLDIPAFDREVVELVQRRLGVGHVGVLHPSLMYRLFSLFWSGQRPLGLLDSHTRYVRYQAAELMDRSRLPREYVAVKFYAARSLPDTPDVRQTLAQVVAALAERWPVVLLDTGLTLDDHADYRFGGSGRVLSAQAWMSPRDNLGVQTQIIAGARAFVGTCGSVAWLAPMLGVDTSALYIDPKWLHVHLGVALRASHKVGGGHFAACDLRALEPLGLLGSPQQQRPPYAAPA